MAIRVKSQRVLVTGAGGFIGQHFLRALDMTGVDIVAQSSRDDLIQAREIVRSTSQVNLADIDCVFHLAGLAHAGARGASMTEMMDVNVNATRALYEKALEARVPRFIWLSSTKVLGDVAEVPVGVNGEYRPEDMYAESKVRGEKALLELAHGDTLAIVRPPLVYGPGVKANFLRLVRWAVSGRPLPLAGATAPRAWLGVDNLCSLLIRLMQSGQNEISDDRSTGRYNRIWHVRDEQEVSVSTLLRNVSDFANRPLHLFRVPGSILRKSATLIGLGDDAQRLLAPFRVDMSDTLTQLDWRPSVSHANGIKEVVAWYLAQS